MKRIMTALILLTGFAASAMAAEVRSVNFAAFQKLSPSFHFEPGIVGKFSDFIAAMEGSQILLLAHTGAAKGGDVINIQQDVLREATGGLSDDGINCSLSFADESTKDTNSYLLGGLCTIFHSGDKESKIKAIIPRTNVPDTAQGVDVWIKLYEDKASGIAFYGNVGKAH